MTLSADGSVKSIDCFRHRRYVASFADYYFLCSPGAAGAAHHGVAVAAVLVDLAAGNAAPAPRATVALVRPDETPVALPVRFTIGPDETYASLLAREGDREYADPLTDERYTLRELYVLAEIDPQAVPGGLVEALAPLADLRLNIAALRATRAELADALDARAFERLDREHAGTVGAAGDLPAVALRGIGRQSTLGRKLSRSTITDVASMTEEALVAQVLEGLEEMAPAQRETIAAQARETWARAGRVVDLVRSWRVR